MSQVFKSEVGAVVFNPALLVCTASSRGSGISVFIFSLQKHCQTMPFRIRPNKNNKRNLERIYL